MHCSFQNRHEMLVFQILLVILTENVCNTSIFKAKERVFKMHVTGGAEGDEAGLPKSQTYSDN